MGTSEVGFVVPDDDVTVQVVGVQRGQRAPPAERVPRGSDEVTITLLAADDWSIEGTILDPDGAPLAHAVVRANTDDSPAWTEFHADRRGRFVLRLSGGDRAFLALTGATFDPAAGRAVEGAFEADPVDVPRGAKDVVLRTRRVPAGRTLRVLVQDPDGKPLGGIPIYLQRPNGGTYLGTGTSDADGAVEFENLIGKSVEVGRGSGAYTMGETWVDPSVAVVPAGRDVVFRFVSGAIVRGVVVDAEGAAVPDATVYANEGQAGRERYAQARADGRFSIALDPSRHLPLTLSASQGGGDRPLLKGTANFEAMPVEPVTLRLAPPPPEAK